MRSTGFAMGSVYTPTTASTKKDASQKFEISKIKKMRTAEKSSTGDQ